MNRFTLYAIAALVLVVDQVTKWQVLRSLSPYHAVVWVNGFLDFALVRNNGAAFGILPNATPWLIAVSIIAIGAILSYSIRTVQPLPRLLGVALALPLGGAIGNLVDRIRPPHLVTDFIHAHWRAYDFPYFNVADSCICVGVGLLAIYFWSRPETTTANGGQTAVREKETI